MYEKLDNCPLCKGHKFTNHLIVNDHSVSTESFALMRCDDCSLIFTNPRPDSENIWRYYQSDQYISHTNSTRNLRELLYKLVRIYALRSKLSLIRKYHPNPSLLDYGCGTGHFLQHALNNKIQVLGIEPTKETTIPKNSAIYNHTFTDLNSLPAKQSFDIITAWHVMEHVHNLRDTFKALVKKLNDGGHLILALPNPSSHDAIKFQEYWAGYDVPRHLYHFNQTSIKTIAKKFKLKLVDTVPMYFDAFYVSMLSEKYKGNKQPLLQGLIQGYNSNNSAKKSGEYSSLIYVLKK